jgi:hypothetical protein
LPADAAIVVKLTGGIGQFLLGIHHLTEGLKGLDRRLASSYAPEIRFRPFQRNCLGCTVNACDTILYGDNPGRHRLRRRWPNHPPSSDRGQHGRYARNDLDALDGSDPRSAPSNVHGSPSDPGRWLTGKGRLSLWPQLGHIGYMAHFALA